jgi:hypothetical protein
VTAEPICVPEDAGKEELEVHRVRVEEALNRVTALAERQANPEPQQEKPFAIKGNFPAWIQDKRRLKSRVMWHKTESWRLPTSLLALILTPLLLRFLPVE